MKTLRTRFCFLTMLGAILSVGIGSVRAAEQYDGRTYYEVDGPVEVVHERLVPRSKFAGVQWVAARIHNAQWVSVSLTNDHPGAPAGYYPHWAVAASDWRTGEALWHYRTSPHDHAAAQVRAGGFSADGEKVFLAGGADPFAKVIAFESRTGETAWQWMKHTGGVLDLAVCPLGDRLYAAGLMNYGEDEEFFAAALDARTGEDLWQAKSWDGDWLWAVRAAINHESDSLFLLSLRDEGQWQLARLNVFTGAILNVTDVQPLFYSSVRMAATPGAILIAGEGEVDSGKKVFLGAHDPATGDELWTAIFGIEEARANQLRGFRLSEDDSMVFLATHHPPDVSGQPHVSVLHAVNVDSGDIAWSVMHEAESITPRIGRIAVDPMSGEVIAAGNDAAHGRMIIQGHHPATGDVLWTVTRPVESLGIDDVEAVAGGASIFFTAAPLRPDHYYGSEGSASLRIGSPGNFAEWLAWHFTATEREKPEVREVHGDPGGFGVPNLLRYALGLDSQRPDRAKLPWPRTVTVGINGEIERYMGLTYRVQPSATDIEYIPEVSGDMTEWIRVPEANIMRREENADGTETVTIADWVPLGDAEADRRFMRLRVERVE